MVYNILTKTLRGVWEYKKSVEINVYNNNGNKTGENKNG